MKVVPTNINQSESTPILPKTNAETLDVDTNEKRLTQKALDEVDEASMESFPASDPPAYTAAHA